MPNDIIDNQEQKLVDHINNILGSTDSARFAVGYFFLSGLEAIQDKLSHVKKLRLLIGNTTNRETIEQISEGYKRLELVDSLEERERYLKKSEQQRRSEETAANLREAVEVMDQTDESQSLVKTLIQLIEEKRLEVKVYTKGRLHAKAYIFDYQEGAYENGIAIVGSSNLTLSGLSHNTELNVVVHGNDNHHNLGNWFDRLWNEAQDFEAHLMNELKSSWASSPATPYDIYMKTLYSLVADRLEDEEKKEILWDDEITRSLAEFQKVAVRQAIMMIRDHGGAFISDVVGLGKSYIGAGILKHFARIQNARALIICPKPLVDMWEDYNETFQLNARVLPMSLLRSNEDDGGTNILDDIKYKDRDFVLIDESHNFRHQTSQRYEILQDYLAKGGKKVCLLTATPRNKDAKDVYNQIKLFHQDDITHLPIDPPNLKEYFKLIAAREKRIQDLLIHLLIRRTRRHILRYYGFTDDTNRPMRELSDQKAKVYIDGPKRAYVMVAGDHQYFPKRGLETLRYSIEDTYSGLYSQIRGYLGHAQAKDYIPKPGLELTYARYGLWHYVIPSKCNNEPYNELHRAGINLRGLIRVMLFKRFESSVEAFRQTLKRLKRTHEVFLKAIDNGFVPAGDDAQRLLYESDRYEEVELLDALAETSSKYNIADFNEPLLRKHIQSDIELLEDMLDLVDPITAAKDAKLQTLIKGLQKDIPKTTGKVLIFTQYSDTAKYIYESLKPLYADNEIDCIFGTDKSKALMAARFSPKSNPHMRIGTAKELKILVATDVMSEGLNLQDGDVVVNYDLHWNPVRLIQRFGRIDRIGSKNDVIWGFNFLPEIALEKQLGLHEVLRHRIAEIQETIGEDAQILDNDESVNEDAMYCIYERDSQQLSLFEDEEDDFIDLNEAEELLRSLQAESPDEFARITNLRDGIRSAQATLAEDSYLYVFCQAGKYQQLFILDEDQKIISRDVPKVLGQLKCSKTEPALQMPQDHNRSVMKVLATFNDEVRHRASQQKQSISLTVGQTYVLRELRAFYSNLDNESHADLRGQVSQLEESFKKPLTAAIRKQINNIRRNGITGKRLVEILSEIYHDHGMSEHDFHLRYRVERKSADLPRIICSEALR